MNKATAGGAIFTALGIAIVSYVLGDLMILPQSSNLFATALDGVLVILVIWFVSLSTDWTMSFGDILIITALAGFFEYFFHMWLRRVPSRI
ncbi:MAG: YndM family protein [Paenibacillus sp.]|nr:YndM family protein [Paenibacillus sp.]